MAARLAADQPVIADGVELTVHLVDAVEVGAGRTWRTDQDRLLLNNTYCAETTVFADETVPTAGPTRPGPSLAEWAVAVAADPAGVVRAAPPWLVEEARETRPWSFPSRAFQGAYFRWALDRIAATAPTTITFRRRRGRVVGLDEDAAGRQSVRLEDGERIDADVVIMLQGLLTGPGGDETCALGAAAERDGLIYLPPGMAAERDWDALPAGRPVIIRGLGATFFDALGLLSSGRGGRFVRRADGELGYVASGREPVIMAGSRHGLPYRAKATFPTGLPEPVELTRLSATREQDLIARHGGREDLDAAVLLADLHADLTELYDDAARADRHRTGPGAVAFDLETAAHPAAHPAAHRAAHPATHRIGLPDGWHTFVDRYLDEELDRIRRPDRNPDKIVHRAVETARRRISRLVLARVFDPASVITSLKGEFWPQALALASGPPPERFEQLVALRRAGLVELIGPGLRVGVEEHRFVARTAAGGAAHSAYALAEARVGLGDLRRTDDPLVRSLLGSGQARFHRVRRDGVEHETATLDITTDDFLLIDRDGRPHPRRIVLGSPAGDVQWYAAIGAIPHTADKMLVGAERAAVHALRMIRNG